MKVNVTRAELKTALSAVIKAVPSRTVLPILSCVLIEANDRVTITASDKETTIRSTIDGVVLEGGAVCIDAKMFSEFVQKVSGAEILIKTNEDVVELSCGKSTLSLGLQNAELYPAIPSYEVKSAFKISKPILDSMIARAAFAVDINNPRKEFTAGRLAAENGNLTLTGVNNICVAIISAQVESSDFTVLVNYKALQNLAKISGDEISVSIAENFTIFEIESCEMLVRNMAGVFPNLTAITQAKQTCEITLAPSELFGALDRASIATRAASSDIIPVALTIIDDSFIVKANTSIGKSHEEFTVDKRGECENPIGVNPSYMLSAMSAIYEDVTTVCVTNGKMPITIKGDDYLFVVMPVTI